MSAAILMAHDADPAEQIRKGVGDLSRLSLNYHNVLVGIYIRPEKTKGGLFLSAKFRDEDKYQGKVGLVLKLGPRAFKDTADYSFEPSEIAEVGDWVYFRASDGWDCIVNDQHCRIVSDSRITGKVSAPDMML